MEIREVSIADVFPFEDEYGNQFLSRDYTTKENKEYVHRLAASMKRKGIPDELVELVEDNGIYRIKSGNTRVMAMRELGTEKFPAVVFEQEDLLESIETTIRTNVKKTYEPIEESRFVQQLAMFADDQYVSQTTGMDVAKVKCIRKGAKAVDSAAQAMSLDRLMAIGEFEDDAEAVENLSNCTEDEWERIARRLRDKKANDKLARELEAALADRKIQIGEEADGMRPLRYIYKVSDIPEELPDGTIAERISWGVGFRLYSPDSGESIDPEAKKLEEAKQKAEYSYREGSRNRRSWLAKQIVSGNGLCSMKKLVEGDEDRFSYTVVKFIESIKESDEELSEGVVSHIEVSTLEVIDVFAKFDNNGRYGIRNYTFDGYEERFCSDYKALMDAMEADGYEPSEAEQQLYQEATDFIDKAVDGDD